MLKNLIYLFAFALAATLHAGTTHGQDHSAGDPPELGIEGYSPVSYFEKGEPEMGTPEYAATYNNFVYHFTNAEQVEKFKADPAAYAPLFPNHCPYNLALGRAVAIDPTNFKIAGGYLLIFHRDDEMDGLEKWNSHDDEDELLRRSKNTWKLIKF